VWPDRSGNAGSHFGNHRTGTGASAAIYRFPVRVWTRRSQTIDRRGGV